MYQRKTEDEKKILKCDILKSNEEKTYQKYHYEVWLIEIEIDFSKSFLGCCCCLSVSLTGTLCRRVIEPNAFRGNSQRPVHKNIAKTRGLRVRNLNVVINFRWLMICEGQLESYACGRASMLRQLWNLIALKRISYSFDSSFMKPFATANSATSIRSNI